MTHVLVVDDDPRILRVLRMNLTAHGYTVAVAFDGAGALRAVADSRPDVVVLDLALPDLDGTEVIVGLRCWTPVPIIALSTRVGSTDEVSALDAGADYYVTKPFGMAELLARVRASVRRAAVATADGGPVVDAGDLRVDLAAKKVERGSTEVRLTPTEWGILELLVRHRGKLVGRRELLRIVWGPKYGKETNYLRVYFAQLRRKLEVEPSRPKHLITEPGLGYRFEV